MKWLITTKVEIDLQQLKQKLIEYNCTLDNDLDPIPLGNKEQVFEVAGPKDLPEIVAFDETILSVSPNAEIELWV
ncbi:MAG: hypothetical protein QNJ54_34875 [Prochloraceae cyanobacterium]|nr:hypothetical protein [Prochloraceae cyanobacterium]